MFAPGTAPARFDGAYHDLEGEGQGSDWWTEGVFAGEQQDEITMKRDRVSMHMCVCIYARVCVYIHTCTVCSMQVI